MLSTFDCLLTLLRNAIFNRNDALSVAPDWSELMRQARIHGVEPLVYDAALRLPAHQQPDKALATQMKQVCLYRMQQQTIWLPRIKAAAEALRKAGIEPVLLKGFGLAELYPKPYLRSWSDADIWVGVKNYHAGCKALREAFPEAIHHDEEYEELKHYGIVFPDGNAIELHRVAMDFPTKAEEAHWQTLEVPAMAAAVNDERCRLSIPPARSPQETSRGNCQLAVPSEPFNLLFVFLHAWEHFCSTGMPLKQVVDIALLVQRDYEPLSSDDKARYDRYLLSNLRRFHVREAWLLVACVVHYVTGITLPLVSNSAAGSPKSFARVGCIVGGLTSNSAAFLSRVLSEGQCRAQEFALGGDNRYDERERAKQMPVWRRKILTLRQRSGHARFLRQFAPAYARHLWWANFAKGIRRTIRRERMIDY